METRNNALVMSPWRQSIWVSHEIGIIILPAPCLVSNQLQGPRPGQKQYRITGTPGSLRMNGLVPGSKLLRKVLERSLEWEGLYMVGWYVAGLALPRGYLPTTPYSLGNKNWRTHEIGIIITPAPWLQGGSNEGETNIHFLRPPPHQCQALSQVQGLEMGFPSWSERTVDRVLTSHRGGPWFDP